MEVSSSEELVDPTYHVSAQSTGGLAKRLLAHQSIEALNERVDVGAPSVCSIHHTKLNLILQNRKILISI